MDIELLNWLKDGKYRITILKLLNNNPLLSSELANKLELNRASMSRILGDLKSMDLVKPNSNKSRTVTYTLTQKGLTIINEINKLGE